MAWIRIPRWSSRRIRAASSAALPDSSASAIRISRSTMASTCPIIASKEPSRAGGGMTPANDPTSRSTRWTPLRTSSAASPRAFGVVNPRPNSVLVSSRTRSFASLFARQIAFAWSSHPARPPVDSVRVRSDVVGLPTELNDEPPQPPKARATSKAVAPRPDQKCRPPTSPLPVDLGGNLPAPDARRPRSGRFGVVVQLHRRLATPVRDVAGRRLEARRADSGKILAGGSGRRVKGLRKFVIGLPDGRPGRPPPR
jgi:hypothetical protein